MTNEKKYIDADLHCINCFYMPMCMNIAKGESTLTSEPCSHFIASADVTEVRHGEWKGWTTSAFMKIDDYGEPLYSDRKFYRCSQCHYGTVVKTKYCPNCGAKMDGKEQNDS